MAIASSLQAYLKQKAIHYDVISHRYTPTSFGSAAAAHLPRESVAKCVLLEDDFGYVMAVLPATHRLSLREVKAYTQRNLGLAAEDDIGQICADCEYGALPPVGDIYGVDMLVDDSIAQRSDIYFEAGDHQSLIHVDGEDFSALAASAEYLRLSQPR